MSFDENLLQPQATPRTSQRQVKRMNNNALYMVIGAVAIFLLVMMYVAYDRQQVQNARLKKVAKDDQPVDTSQYAKKLVNGLGSGVVASSSGTTAQPVEGIVPAAASASMPPPSVGTVGTSAAAPAAEKLAALKEKMFEEAVLSPTTLPPQPSSISLSSSAMNGQQNRSSRGGDPYGPAGGGAASYPFPQQPQPKDNMSENSLTRFAGQGGKDRWLPAGYLQAPRSRFELRAGFVIPGVMISGINSDLPGQVIGQVAQDVYDTPTGKYLLIPKGTRVVGAYNANQQFGQTRVLVAWQRLVFPDGKAIDLGAMAGADSAGFSGVHDLTHTHMTQAITAAVMISAIVGGVAYAENISNPQGTTSTNGNQNLSASMASSFGNTLGIFITQMLQKYLNVSPTQIIRPGFRFNIMVNKDIDFGKPYQNFDYRVSTH